MLRFNYNPPPCHLKKGFYLQLHIYGRKSNYPYPQLGAIISNSCLSDLVLDKN